MTRRTLFLGLLTILVCMVIVSATLGRDLYQGHRPELSSFVVIHFAGYLFFLLMPVEALVPYYLSENHSGLVLIGLALVTAVAAQAIDYGIGRLVAQQVIQNVIGEKRFERFRGDIERWGSWAIFVFNLLPLSSPNMMLVAGMTRFGPARAFAYSIVGLLLKYVGIVYLFGPPGALTPDLS